MAGNTPDNSDGAVPLSNNAIRLVNAINKLRIQTEALSKVPIVSPWRAHTQQDAAFIQLEHDERDKFVTDLKEGLARMMSLDLTLPLDQEPLDRMIEASNSLAQDAQYKRSALFWYTDAVPSDAWPTTPRSLNSLWDSGSASVPQILRSQLGEWPPKGLDVPQAFNPSKELTLEESSPNGTHGRAQGSTIRVARDADGNINPIVAVHELTHVVQWGSHELNPPVVTGTVANRYANGLFTRYREKNAERLYREFGGKGIYEHWNSRGDKPSVNYVLQGNTYLDYFSRGNELQAEMHALLVDGYKTWGRFPQNKAELQMALYDMGVKPPEGWIPESPELQQAYNAFHGKVHAFRACDSALYPGELFEIGHGSDGQCQAMRLTLAMQRLTPEGQQMFWNHLLPSLCADAYQNIYNDRQAYERFGFIDPTKARERSATKSEQSSMQQPTELWDNHPASRIEAPTVNDGIQPNVLPSSAQEIKAQPQPVAPSDVVQQATQDIYPVLLSREEVDQLLRQAGLDEGVSRSSPATVEQAPTVQHRSVEQLPPTKPEAEHGTRQQEQASQQQKAPQPAPERLAPQQDSGSQNAGLVLREPSPEEERRAEVRQMAAYLADDIKTLDGNSAYQVLGVSRDSTQEQRDEAYLSAWSNTADPEQLRVIEAAHNATSFDNKTAYDMFLSHSAGNEASSSSGRSPFNQDEVSSGAGSKSFRLRPEDDFPQTGTARAHALGGLVSRAFDMHEHGASGMDKASLTVDATGFITANHGAGFVGQLLGAASQFQKGYDRGGMKEGGIEGGKALGNSIIAGEIMQPGSTIAAVRNLGELQNLPAQLGKAIDLAKDGVTVVREGQTVVKLGEGVNAFREAATLANGAKAIEGGADLSRKMAFINAAITTIDESTHYWTGERAYNTNNYVQTEVHVGLALDPVAAVSFGKLHFPGSTAVSRKLAENAELFNALHHDPTLQAALVRGAHLSFDHDDLNRPLVQNYAHLQGIAQQVAQYLPDGKIDGHSVSDAAEFNKIDFSKPENDNAFGSALAQAEGQARDAWLKTNESSSMVSKIWRHVSPLGAITPESELIASPFGNDDQTREHIEADRRMQELSAARTEYLNYRDNYTQHKQDIDNKYAAAFDLLGKDVQDAALVDLKTGYPAYRKDREDKHAGPILTEEAYIQQNKSSIMRDEAKLEKYGFQVFEKLDPNVRAVINAKLENDYPAYQAQMQQEHKPVLTKEGYAKASKIDIVNDPAALEQFKIATDRGFAVLADNYYPELRKEFGDLSPDEMKARLSALAARDPDAFAQKITGYENQRQQAANTARTAVATVAADAEAANWNLTVNAAAQITAAQDAAAEKAEQERLFAEQAEARVRAMQHAEREQAEAEAAQKRIYAYDTQRDGPGRQNLTFDQYEQKKKDLAEVAQFHGDAGNPTFAALLRGQSFALGAGGTHVDDAHATGQDAVSANSSVNNGRTAAHDRHV